MNILALTSVYPQPDDGKEIVTPTVKYFCEKWAETGHNIIVIHNNSCFPRLFYMIPNRMRKRLSSKLGHNLPTAKSRKELHRIEHNVSIYRLPIVKAVPHGRFSTKKINKQIHRIDKILEDECFIPDVIIAHWVNPQIQLLPILGQKYCAKTSLVFHGDCFFKNIERFQLTHTIRKLDAVGCRNNDYAEYVKNSLDLKKKPFICYSGIPDFQAATQEQRLKNGIQLVQNKEFIFVGRLVKYKNVDVVIKALYRTYPDQSFKLHIVGEGAELENLQSLSSDLNLSDNIVFHGQMSREDVFELMKRCFCFTMVSDNETFGMVYIEAMLAGCVTVAAKNCGVDGIIVNGENGYLSEQGNVEMLVEIYRQIDEQPKKNIHQLREKAIETALEMTDSKVAVKYLEDVLNWNEV